MKFQPVSENGLMLYLGDSISDQAADAVQHAVASIDAALANDIIDLVPSYASVLVLFDPLAFSHQVIAGRVRQALEENRSAATLAHKRVVLPVYYSHEVGPDLEAIANATGLGVEGVIARHSAVHYRVYAIGFAPGFAYLGEVDPLLATPRLASPRPRIPAGSVAIADRQTAVYPSESPGGWNLIGRCPVPMFDAAQSPNMPVAVGDSVQFEPVSRAAFIAHGGELS